MNEEIEERVDCKIDVTEVPCDCQEQVRNMDIKQKNYNDKNPKKDEDSKQKIKGMCPNLFGIVKKRKANEIPSKIAVIL